MFTRVLSYAVAAAALLAAAPALAAEDGARPHAAGCCCPQGGTPEGQAERAGARQQQEPRDAERRAAPESPYEPNESYGG
jgi:hypothetical protein